MIPFVQKYSKHDITNEVWGQIVLFIFITEYCRSDISLGPLVLSSSNSLHLKCLTGALFLRSHLFDRLRHPSISPKVPRNLRFVNTVLEECYIWKSTLAVLIISWYYLKRGRILQGRHERARRRQHPILGSVCFGSPRAQSRRAPLQLTSSLLCSFLLKHQFSPILLQNVYW